MTDTPFHDQQTLQLAAPEDGDDLWPVQGRRAGIRLRLPTAILATLLVAGIGFWGGSYLQKHQGSSGTTAAATGAGAFAAFRNARARSAPAGATPATGAGSSTSNGAAGTLTVLQGNTLWVTTSTGSLVKVKLTTATTVTRNAASTKQSLRPGDTVVVQGATAKNGTVSASSVAATAKGVSSGGGFGGAAGAFGGSATG
jgi:hypothetical protein